jgi:hypothetical protein
MRVTYEVGSYNPRRYGRPWLGRVTVWAIGQKPEIEFGRAVDAWTAEIDANPGQIVRYGQKDTRRDSGSVRDWGIVLADGSVRECSASEARKHWLAGCPVPVAEPDLTNVVAIGGAR